MIRTAVSIVPWSLRSRIRRVPGLAQFQRWLVRTTLDGREFEHRVDAGPAKGVRFWVRMPEDKGIWTGGYEREFAGRVAAAIPKGGVSYDIGGWHGFFSGVMAANGARKVVVFEPLPTNIERIQRVMALNPGLPIELMATALGEKSGEAELVIMPESSMAKLAASSFQRDQTVGERIVVPIVAIDELVASGKAPPPDLMKLDVEGAELMVLKGASRTLAAHGPRIFAEVHSSALLVDVTAFLTGLGYQVDRIDSDPAAALRNDVFQIDARRLRN